MIVPALSGFVLGIGLIVPIGAQNAHVLRAGAHAPRGQLITTVLIVIAIDAALIIAGGYGLATVLDEHDLLRAALLLVGAVLLARLAREAFVAARAGVAGAPADDDPAGRRAPSRWYWPGRTLLVSLGNPHVMIDTVAVIGGAAIAQSAADRPFFLAGAVVASAVWFSLLAVAGLMLVRRYGARAMVALDWFSAVVLSVVPLVLLVAAVRLLS